MTKAVVAASDNTKWMATASYGTAAVFAALFLAGMVTIAWRHLLRLIALLLTPLAPLTRSTCQLLARTPLRRGALRRYFYPARHRQLAT